MRLVHRLAAGRVAVPVLAGASGAGFPQNLLGKEPGQILTQSTSRVDFFFFFFSGASFPRAREVASAPAVFNAARSIRSLASSKALKPVFDPITSTTICSLISR